MSKSLILREDIKDLPDTPCHPVGSSFISRTFGNAKKVNRSFQSSWCHRLVGYIMITHKILCFVSTAVRLLCDH